jgi:hypothetical protein
MPAALSCFVVVLTRMEVKRRRVQTPDPARRQNPGFNERAHGFRAFNELLLEAQKRGLLKLERDKQVGTYIVRAIE